MQGILRDQNKPRLVRMHQMSMGGAVLYGFLPQYSKMNACAAHTRTVNYEIRDPALRVGGG